MKKKSKEHILLYKILFTLLIVTFYILGRNVYVYGVDTSKYQSVNIDVQTVFLQAVSGDSKNISVFALGLWPYMIASMFAVVYMAIKSLDKSTRISPNYLNKVTLVSMMIIAVIQAVLKIRKYTYLDGYDTLWVKGINFVELIAGMLIIIYICDICTKYGLGGKSAVFLVNIFDGILSMVSGKSLEEIRIPILVGVIEAFLLILLDNTEKRIPVQRVSIHNIYADKNYIAYSFATVGIMPLMFASAFFSLVQMLFMGLAKLYPDNFRLVDISQNMTMDKLMGMIVYIVIIAIINIVFSFIILRPFSTAENLNKSGDSLENIYAGKPTKRYLVGCVTRLAIYSSIVYGLFMAVPFALLLLGVMDASLVLLPSSIMMTTGLWLMFYREAEVYIHLDKYKTFI